MKSVLDEHRFRYCDAVRSVLSVRTSCRDQTSCHNPVGESPNMAKVRTMKLRTSTAPALAVWEDDFDRLSNSVVDLLQQGDLDGAEQACAELRKH
jgi:hypothetical protein